MTSVIVSRKGHITIPARVLEALHLSTGDRVEFVEVEPGRYEFIAATCPMTALKGMFGPASKTVLIEDMNVAIAIHGASVR